MSKRILLSAWVACSLAAAPAIAAPITYTFTGLVFFTNDGPATDLQYVNGSFTLDPSTFDKRNTETDGTGFQKKAGVYPYGSCSQPCTPQTDPLQVSGQAGSGSSLVSVGGGTGFDLAQITIDRRGGLNSAQVKVASYWDGFRESQILLEISDNLGANSLIFPDPSGGLDVTQSINWTAINELVSFPHRVDANFYMANWSQEGEITLSFSGRLTSVVESTQVPEPSALALTGLGFVAMVAARPRRRQQPLHLTRHLR